MPKGPSKKIWPKRGQVLIILAGPYRGKRVICLQEVQHAVFLVTGPFKVNGVPLRRVNRRYVICTSTYVDIGDVGSKVPDELFQKKPKNRPNPSGGSKEKTEEKFFEEKEKKRNAFMELRKNTQKEIDTPLIQKLKEADPLLLKYLASTFTLQNNTKPHELKF